MSITEAVRNGGDDSLRWVASRARDLVELLMDNFAELEKFPDLMEAIANLLLDILKLVKVHD